MRRSLLAGLLACACATPAYAAPGLGAEVYGARVEKGEPEFEVIYGALEGGPEDGEDVIKLEAAYGVTDKLKLGILAEFEKEIGSGREAEGIGIEAIYELGSAGGIDFAVYGEYEFGLSGHTDKVETKLLVQHDRGPLDVRFNLIAEKELESGAKVELEYAASADVAAFGELRLGIQAYGQLGTFDKFLPNAEHFVGPVAKFEIEGLGPELEIEAGYLFALGEARDETDGQFRLKLEIEF
ncbi:MAG: hypothetical protein KDE55_08120 [Novosphingobium sp.]|nr:hypothetical protein [Novosphingobium sp.]